MTEFIDLFSLSPSMCMSSESIVLLGANAPFFLPLKLTEVVYNAFTDLL